MGTLSRMSAGRSWPAAMTLDPHATRDDHGAKIALAS
jgi:hypothetical protein